MAYYYKVAAYDATGDSASAGMTCPVATVIAYDGFNYTTVNGANPWQGGDTGLGFGSNTWSLTSTTNATVVTGSLATNISGHTLTTSGNSVTLTHTDKATDTLASTVGADGTTLWVGFEFQTSGNKAEVDIGPVNNQLRLGATWSNINAVAVVGGTSYYMGNGNTITSNTTYFVAYQIQYHTSGDVITQYINPTPGVTPTTNQGQLTLSVHVPATSTISLWSSTYGNIGTYDEIRLGASYAAVAPVSSIVDVPAVPTNVVATPNASALNVGLAWTETGGATGYNIQRSSNGGSTWFSVASGITTTTYTDITSLVGDTSYIYQVNAYNTVGTNSAWSASSNIALTIPATPTSVSAAASTSAQSISLTWSEGGNGASSYAIQRSADGGTTWSSVATGVTNTNYTDSTGLSPNTSYLYEVDATDATGTTSWSANSNAALTIPAAPTNLVATPGTSTIVLTWTDPSPTTNITGYHVYRSTDNATWGSVYGTASGPTATIFTDSSPTAGTGYYYKVAAYDATGDSAAAGMTCPVATVIAYDGFNYTTVNGANPWQGGDTGLGFGSNTWSLTSTTDATVVTGSLATNILRTYPDHLWEFRHPHPRRQGHRDACLDSGRGRYDALGRIRVPDLRQQGGSRYRARQQPAPPRRHMV